MKVFAAQDHVTILAANGTIYGMGKHANSQEENKDEKKEQLRKIRLPAGFNPIDIQKIHVGKSTRNILMKDGRVLFNG